MRRFPLALAIPLSLAATLFGAAIGARGCQPEPAPIEVIELPAVVETQPDIDDLIARTLRVTDELAEAAALLEEAREN